MTFFAVTVLSANGIGVENPVESPASYRPANLGKVWRVERPGVVRQFVPEGNQVAQMVNLLVVRATESSSPEEAWRKLVSPTDTVGIKINAASGPLLGTRRAVVEAVARGVAQAGVPSSHIIVWDRARADLARAGFLDREGRSTSPHFQVRWVRSASDYDGQSRLYASRTGRLIWGDREFRSGLAENISNFSHLPRFVTSELTAHIHLPAMVPAEGVGIVGAVAGLTAGAVDNWRRFFSGDSLALAEMYLHPHIGPRVRLIIIDGLIAQYADGPDPRINDAAALGLLLGGFDPIALDQVALERIDGLRSQRRWLPIRDRATYLSLGGAAWNRAATACCDWLVSGLPRC
ncbi:MAG: DUF362 domain-containing protein [Verrucomicrobiia bacterium]